MNRPHLRTLSLALALFAAARPAAAATFMVNTLVESVDVNPGDGICADSSSLCSFRAALMEVAARTGSDTINFSVSGTIVLTSAIPNVTQPSTTIDGGLQTVVIQGGAVGGLHLNSSSNVVANLTFSGFGAFDAITIQGAQNGNLLERLVIGGSTTAAGIVIGGNGSVVVGCKIGTDATGLVANPNGTGVVVLPSSTNRIGGTFVAERNLISGNVNGVVIQPGAFLTSVEGNFIGTDATGLAALPNTGTAAVSAAGNLTSIGDTAAGSGNVISGNSGMGIRFKGSGSLNSQAAGNLIGLAADGSTVLGNGGFGVYVAPSSSGTTIGGTSAVARNVISGNTSSSGYGIFIGSSVTGTKILGNYIGTDGTGLLARGNTIGIYMQSAGTIGGTAAGSGNVISGNGVGVQLQFITSGALVQGNTIGVAADGTTPLGNTGAGIEVKDGAFFSTIGGSAAGAPNVIAHNGAQGIFVGATSASEPIGIAILGNSIQLNGALGIDLAPGGVAGVTLNDVCDGDSGPNNLQNSPVITAAAPSGPNTKIDGILNSAAGGTFRVEVFSSPAADPSGSGEGATFLGALPAVATDGSCSGTWTITVPGLHATEAITATATDALGSTSEFSAAFLATPVTLTGFTAE